MFTEINGWMGGRVDGRVQPSAQGRSQSAAEPGLPGSGACPLEPLTWVLGKRPHLLRYLGAEVSPACVHTFWRAKKSVQHIINYFVFHSNIPVAQNDIK